MKEYTKDDPEKFAKGREARICQSDKGEWKLTTGERKRILTEHIFGVDIDPQAVEVTKLSLLLKVLEGENKLSVSQQMALFLERALPDLGRNIQCGNSLIGPDFYEGQQMSLLDDETRARVNPFDWQASFPEVFKDGGFDAVIGNPPWGATLDSREETYFREKYDVAKTSTIDTYSLFIEQATLRLKADGLLGLYSTRYIFRKHELLPTRKFLVLENSILDLVETGTCFSPGKGYLVPSI